MSPLVAPIGMAYLHKSTIFGIVVVTCSQKPFTFVTVRSYENTCGIKSVREETKYLILACEDVDNQCVPVHFEGNPNNAKPDNNARACQDPDKAGAGATAVGTTTCLWLLASVTVLLVNAQ